jgi:hypothetical protein
MEHIQDTAFRHPLLDGGFQGQDGWECGRALVAFEMRFAVGINPYQENNHLHARML